MLASGVALWSTTRIAEKVFDHDVFWIAGIGVLNLAVAADLIAGHRWCRFSSTVHLAMARAAAVVLACDRGCRGSAAAARTSRSRSTDPPAEARAARAVADDLLAFMDREQVVATPGPIDQDAWGIAAGAILELQKHQRLVSVEDDWLVMFTPQCSPGQAERTRWSRLQRRPNMCAWQRAVCGLARRTRAGVHPRRTPVDRRRRFSSGSNFDDVRQPVRVSVHSP